MVAVGCVPREVRHEASGAVRCPPAPPSVGAPTPSSCSVFISLPSCRCRRAPRRPTCGTTWSTGCVCVCWVCVVIQSGELREAGSAGVARPAPCWAWTTSAATTSSTTWRRRATTTTSLFIVTIVILPSAVTIVILPSPSHRLAALLSVHPLSHHHRHYHLCDVFVTLAARPLDRGATTGPRATVASSSTGSEPGRRRRRAPSGRWAAERAGAEHVAAGALRLRTQRPSCAVGGGALRRRRALRRRPTNGLALHHWTWTRGGIPWCRRLRWGSLRARHAPRALRPSRKLNVGPRTDFGCTHGWASGAVIFLTCRRVRA